MSDCHMRLPNSAQYRFCEKWRVSELLRVLFPSRFPTSFHFEGRRTEHGKVYDIVKVSPTGMGAVVLWIDHQSHLLFRFVDGDDQATDLTDYRRVDGVMVPFTESSEGVTVKSESVKFEAAGAVSFTLPKDLRP